MTAPITAGPSRREDVFVSLCIPESPGSARDVDLVVAAAQTVAAAFRYHEILLVAGVDEDDLLLRQCLRRCSNLRILRTRAVSQHYSDRVVAASEAIGDIVVITSLAEVGHLDLIGLISTAAENDAISVFRRQEPILGGRGLSNMPLAVLGAASRFRISVSDMRTLAIPRSWLTRLLAHPQHNLALRFPPLGEGFLIHHIPVSGVPILQSGKTGNGRRVGLLYSLAIHAAPAILAGVGVLSVVVVVGALLFILYAIAALFVVKHLQEGWFTTSLAQGATACYLGLAILGLSLGLQKVLSNAGPHIDDLVVEEINNTDLFSDIQQLNVSIDIDKVGQSPAKVVAP